MDEAQAKLAELQQQLGGKELTQENYAALEEKKRQQAERKQMLLARICSPEALDRLNRIRLVKPQLVENVEANLIQAAQKGSLGGKVDDSRMKGLLTSMESDSKPKVTFQRKNYFDDDSDDDNDDDLL